MPAEPAEPPPSQVAYYDDEGTTCHAVVSADALAEFLDYYRGRVIDVRPAPAA